MSEDQAKVALIESTEQLRALTRNYVNACQTARQAQTEALAALLEAGVSQSEVARIMNTTRQRVHALCKAL